MDIAPAKQRCTQFFTNNGLQWGDHNDALLEEALTHKSYSADFPQQAIPHNERLEFLGDALLGAIIANRLWEDYSEQSEADLTLKKIYLIKEPTLAKAALSFGLGERIRLGKWEERSWWREKDAILADACEAWIAYLWRQFWRDVVTSFVITYIYPYRDDSGAVRGKSYKSLLQERAQKTYQQLPVYTEEAAQTESSGNILTYRSEVVVAGKVLAEATAGNKRKAQEEAARIAYEVIEAKGK
jgi:ribonuclease III